MITKGTDLKDRYMNQLMCREVLLVVHVCPFVVHGYPSPLKTFPIIKVVNGFLKILLRSPVSFNEKQFIDEA